MKAQKIIITLYHDGIRDHVPTLDVAGFPPISEKPRPDDNIIVLSAVNKMIGALQIGNIVDDKNKCQKVEKIH